MNGNAGWMLSLLFENDAESNLTAKVRYAFMDTVSSLVRKDFSYQIGDWCREHGVQYIGHVIEDNNHHSRTASSLGHYFRGLQGQDMSGIDDIGGQVYPQGEHDTYDRGMFQARNGEFYHFVLGKLAASAAAIEPAKKGRAMCEIFGNYGWQEGVRLEKYLAEDQIEQVICGGENYGGFRPCRYEWVKVLSDQCRLHNVTFNFIETGTYFEINGKTYHIPDKRTQSQQAFRSGLNFRGKEIHFHLTDEWGYDIPQENLYVPAYHPVTCRECANRLTCNGCSDCGKCTGK